MKFLASTLIFIPWFLVWIVSLFAVPFMLRTEWNGRTTWFGNFKYGRGDTHYKAPSEGKLWKQYRFLCIRNPVSNFGKQVLAVKDADWVWLYDHKIIGRFHFKFGWKFPTEEKPGIRTYIYRPWITNE